MKTSHPGRRAAIAAVSLATISALGLSGCSSSAGDSGTTELTVMAWASSTQAKQYEAIFDVYEEKNPGVTVKLEWMDVGSYQDKLNTKFAAGSPPDVMFLVGSWLGEYASRGALADLREYDDIIDFEAMDDTIVSANDLEGTTYSVPTGSTTIGLVYNKEIVEQAGLAMPDDSSWTWDEFAEFNNAITESTGGTTYGTGFFVPWVPTVSVYARQRGEDFYTADGKLGVSEATIAEYFQMTADMRDAGGFAPAGSLEDQGNSPEQSPLGRKFIASQSIPSNVFGDYNSVLDSKLELLRFPGETEGERRGYQVTPTLLWAQAAQSKHPEEAAGLIDFLSNDIESFEGRSTLLGVPVNPDVAAELSADLDPDAQTFVDFVLDVQKEDLPETFIEPAGAGEVANALASVATEVEFGRLSPQDAAKKFITDAKAALEQAAS